MNRILVEIKQLSRDITSTTMSLFKVLIPMIILIKIAEEMGGVALFGKQLEPLMTMLGLPSSIALVWATTMLTNLYAGILVLINTDVALTVAQITVLSSLLLLTHGLPIEGVISKQAGVPLWAVLLLRIGGGIVFAWLQHLYFESTVTNQRVAKVIWQNKPTIDETIFNWAIGQVENLVSIFLVISALIGVLRLLKLLGIEHLMGLLMMPLLKVLQVSKEAANLAVIGITLGLSYGGGLIINETKNGTLTPKDAFITIMLLNLLHSIFEDTALVLLLGADLNMVLWARILFSICLMAIISQIYGALTSKNSYNTRKIKKQSQL